VSTAAMNAFCGAVRLDIHTTSAYRASRLLYST